MKPPMNADSRGWIRRKSASIGVDRRFLPARRYEGSLATYSEEAQPFAAHGPFGVQALACPGQCSLKAELRTCIRDDAKFDHSVSFCWHLVALVRAADYR